ncbi:RICIN domain-containing protein [Maribacter sp. ANRC-HE7]|uniref:RICIN domain-containing protein n=1 Tax=Maribacter aquimaris TaxID=2737171 RepID=A0ABR7V2D0_9FLAO|nr:M12 family metallopeptidase [Maribacter aquimaris]MBD0778977.1 RICIN domain-containing protein [Maribacter aquimaris]
MTLKIKSKRNLICLTIGILSLVFSLPIQAQIVRDHRNKKKAEKSEIEMFHPKSTERIEKKVNAYLPFHQASKLVAMEFVDGMAVMEGDIVLGPSLLYSGENQFAVVIDGDTYRWRDGIIPFTIESGHPQSELILQAIQHIHEQTNLKLVSRTNENDYVTFITGDGCWSRIGRCGGKQSINIGACGFGSIVHEILHTAGLWHEQSREDRNEHVTILWENIKPDKKNNFERHISDGIDIGQYDCNSIMHYPPYAFSKSILPTITSTKCTSFGQRSGMSSGDKMAINELYKVKVPENLTNRPWYLVVRHSGKVVNIHGGRLNPKANVLQYELNHKDSQKFRLLNAGNGYYYIQNLGSNLVLDVEGGNASAPTNVWQYPKNGTDAQKWQLIDAGSGNYYIRSKLGDLNLDVEGGLKDNGTNIRVAATKGGPAQQFKLKEAAYSPPPKDSYTKPLEHYWNGTRKDNFSTASIAGKNNALNGNYRFVRVDGYVLNKPTSTEGTAVPLYLYYNNTRKDNFTTASTEGIRAAEAGGYRKAGIEGYVLSTVKTKYKHLYKPLWLYYHDVRKDNFVTATKQGMDVAEAGGYRKVRIEGYVRVDQTSNLATNLNNKAKN